MVGWGNEKRGSDSNAEALLGEYVDGLGGRGGVSAAGIADFTERPRVFCACDEPDCGPGVFSGGFGEAGVCKNDAAVGGVFGSRGDNPLFDGQSFSCDAVGARPGVIGSCGRVESAGGHLAGGKGAGLGKPLYATGYGYTSADG